MKGVGYAISAVSVLLLGSVAWPPPTEPRWKALALGAGMTTSILGMLVRFLQHRREKQAIAFATRGAEREMAGETAERPAR